MEEHIDTLDSLFNFGSCTYTTTYKNRQCTVTIRVVSRAEQYYNYVLPVEGVREAIMDMLDRSISSEQKSTSFTACMFEKLPALEVPIAQVPVYQLTPLEVGIKMSETVDNNHGTTGHVATRFSDFAG